MDDLLPYYERELAFLRRHSADFAQKYPKIAGRLLLSGDVGDDPHVERLIESFALLASRVHKRLDDDLPEITEALLEVLYPHYLRPFPSCSIIQLQLSDSGAHLGKKTLLPRGTLLSSRPVRGVPCRFRTAFDVDLAPIELKSVSFKAHPVFPEGTTPLPRGGALLTLELALNNAQADWGQLGLDRLRVHIDGEASQVDALRSALCQHATGVYVQTRDIGPWQHLRQALPQQVGFAPQEALLDFDARSHQAYRYLTEFFAFPEKFNFVDLPLPKASFVGAARSVRLHYVIDNAHASHNLLALLEAATVKNLLLFCTPVVNLFVQRADPIRLTQKKTSYTVLPDARKAFAFDVYAINKVYRVNKTLQGEQVEEIPPLLSLQHEQLLQDSSISGCYWALHRNESVANLSPGHEYELSIVDTHFDPVTPKVETLSLEVQATNRDLPVQLSIANPGGDLFLEGGGPVRQVNMLRKPTRPLRFTRDKGTLWRLISHLSLNHLSLSGTGVDALKEMLHLYDLSRSSSNRRLLAGIRDVSYSPATAYLSGKPFANFVRGIQVRLTVDESHFVGSGLHLFASLLEHFFALYVQVNSFAQLTVVSARTHEELIQCPPRNGLIPLL